MSPTLGKGRLYSPTPRSQPLLVPRTGKIADEACPYKIPTSAQFRVSVSILVMGPPASYAQFNHDSGGFIGHLNDPGNGSSMTHNPKVGGSNPPPATQNRRSEPARWAGSSVARRNPTNWRHPSRRAVRRAPHLGLLVLSCCSERRSRERWLAHGAQRRNMSSNNIGVPLRRDRGSGSQGDR